MLLNIVIITTTTTNQKVTETEIETRKAKTNKFHFIMFNYL